jgi:hypothetical protein
MEERLPEPPGTSPEIREHLPDASPVLQLLTADLENLRRLGRVREGPCVAFVSEGGGELACVRPLQNNDQITTRPRPFFHGVP